MESVGGTSLTEAVEQVAPHGTIVVFGSSSGEPTPLSFRQFRPGNEAARIQTFMSYASGPGFGADLRTLAELAADGRLTIEVGMDVTWTEAARAIDALSQRAFSGKAVFHFGS